MAKNYQRLWKDVTSTSDEGKAVRTLADILLDKDGRTFISNLAREDAELCIEILDHGLAEHNLKTTEKQVFFVALRRLAAIHGRLPESMMIAEDLKVSDKVLASGGFADVRTGTYMGHLVAVKTMRVAEQDGFLKIRKQFCKEVVLWNTLSHPNILKLSGVQGDMDRGHFITISEWMAHGNAMEYIRKNHVNRLELLHGAAQGLKYLHGANLTHGDLKGANILMSNDNPPRACLADFGFMTMVLDPGQPMSCSAQLEGGTMMFMPPELLVPSRFGLKVSLPTPEADIYAFGLVIYQILTGGLPFPGIGIAEITMNAVQGMRPTKPKNASAIGFSDSLWRFVQRCWDGEMESRPKIAEVVSQLGRAAVNWDGVMPPCAQVESVVSASQNPPSDSMAHCGIFGSSSSVAPESPTDLRTISTSSDPLSTTSTQCTEPPSPEALEAVTKPFDEPRNTVAGEDCNTPNIRQTSGDQVWVPNVCAPPSQGRHPYNTVPQPGLPSPYHPNNRGLQALYPGIGQQGMCPPEFHRPQPESRTPTPPPQKEQPPDDVVYLRLDQGHKPPPSQLPPKKRKGFGYLKWKFLSFVGFERSPSPDKKATNFLVLN